MQQEYKLLLQENEQIFMDAPVGIFKSTPSGEYLAVNNEQARIYGYDSPEDMVRSVRDILRQLYVYPEDRERFMDLMEEYGEVFQFHCQMYRKDGSIIWTSRNVKAFKNEKGETIYYNGFTVDITEQKRLAQNLRTSLTELAAIYDNAPNPMILVDEDRRIVKANTAAQTYAQRTEDEMHWKRLGEALNCLYCQNDFGGCGYSEECKYCKLKALIKDAVMDRQNRFDNEACLPLPCYNEGYKEVHFLVNVSHLFIEERNLILVSLQDVTKYKRAEKELQKAKNYAERSEKAKTEFLANMSHEIRTPLNGILGVLQLLKEVDLTNDQDELLQMALQSSERLHGLLSNILDLSKMEADRTRPAQNDFSIKDICEAVISLFKMQARELNIDLQYSIANEVPELLVGDDQRLQQILFNLVGNAIKSTQRNGQVRIEVSTLEQNEIDTWLRFSVLDTGPGFPEEEKDNLFAPFYQGGDESNKNQGSGLGLTIVKRLSEILGGRVEVESELGKGSRFNVHLPFSVRSFGDADSFAQESSREKLDRKRRFLVVEDDEYSRMVVERILEKGGHEVVSKKDGEEALKFIQEDEDIDLILMDICLPNMSGIETARYIKALGPGMAEVPIIAITAQAMDNDKSRILSSEIDGYLAKPFKKEDLLQAINEMIPYIP